MRSVKFYMQLLNMRIGCDIGRIKETGESLCELTP